MKLGSRQAHNDNPGRFPFSQHQRLLEWLTRLTQSNATFDALAEAYRTSLHADTPIDHSIHCDDWQTVADLCGYSLDEFKSAGAGLPLTAAEIEHFRRNHRCKESHVNRDFLTQRSDLPSPLAELYGLYLHRARMDAEATLFLAQSTHSTRVARVMADLLAIGGFANGLEYISYLGLTYSVPAAFDTSLIVDHTNQEATRRLALPADNPSHLLKLTPDEVGALAINLAEKYTLTASDFLEKANLLAEARQDVNRLPTCQQFLTAITENDLPTDESWVMRICSAYSRLFAAWVVELPASHRSIQ